MKAESAASTILFSLIDCKDDDEKKILKLAELILGLISCKNLCQRRKLSISLKGKRLDAVIHNLIHVRVFHNIEKLLKTRSSL